MRVVVHFAARTQVAIAMRARAVTIFSQLEAALFLPTFPRLAKKGHKCESQYGPPALTGKCALLAVFEISSSESGLAAIIHR
jgi:hypothetical protein